MPPLLPLHSRLFFLTRLMLRLNVVAHRVSLLAVTLTGQGDFVYTDAAGFLPLAVASPLTPAFALGFLFGGDLFNLLHQYLCPWVLRIKTPVRMALFDLPVVLVDQPLHQVEDQ